MNDVIQDQMENIFVWNKYVKYCTSIFDFSNASKYS